MKWSEIREKYPNQFVLLKALKSHVDGDKKIVDDVALVKIIENSKEANELLIRSKGDTFVFHTSKDKLSLTIVQNPVYRGIYNYENSI
ncbi:hypothetical protein BD780_000815 [Clostridium tetanomorphum]|uniref:Uncharacterized protein n=1 Tax=Clostridium tetanomorphum TaxID=1553 RepID=A0A923J2P3_CLOTT|nr:hypothetical protein [Clostridium tetanomorphum]KAJ49740.1 hypothetical protein CTM_21518 [Clostridium tetanomorphum DSM 665]KAJ50062.1 hypothetical protein CTM_19889 [Clostridium tetanomorphum DSM 665]MBC2398843.1 hypothetical protein [Clostridium tetanomorphum]MBP1863492.1 hypothetical protein [Clostridium tetanomorphum]NRS83590.1 hypothetical protein [Clostridium tetanomorphum]